MSEEVRSGAGGVPYRAPAPDKPEKKEADPKPEVTVEVSEQETPDEELAKLGLSNDENV